MAERQTTGAVHITELGINIQPAIDSLNELRQKIDGFKEEMNQEPINTSGDTSGSGGSSGGMFRASLAGIESLELRYKQFINTIAGSKLQDDIISNLSANAKDALNDVSALAELVRESGISAKDAREYYKEYDSILKQLKGDLALFNAEAKETGEGFKNTELQSGFVATQKQVESLNTSYRNFLAQLRTTRNVSGDITPLREETEQYAAQMQNLIEEIRNSGTVTEEQSKKFKELDLALQQLKGDFADIKGPAPEKMQEPFIATQKQIETLNNSWKNFLNQLQTAGAGTAMVLPLQEEAKQYASEMENITNKVRQTGVATEEQSKRFTQLAVKLLQLKGAFADIKVPTKEFQQLSTEIDKTVKELDKLSTKTIKSSSKSEIESLKNQYTELNDRIKSGNITMEEAQAQSATLGQRFNELTNRIEAGDGVLNNFFTRLGNRVAWMTAMQLVNLVQQAFSNFIGTIQETEDAVIEVQRVLGDTAVTNEQVSQTLYDIAYEYGQTFENVQDAFVKFVQTGMDFQEATEAVRATMLALNTAELEVSEATTGLIAVISQFGYEGSDLEAIIDKINITADNFAVTSEKIVSALQRAGGTAKAFGMSLDETIAVITALSEATGRAGANIGTALNSLIMFSQKDEALKKFSEFLGQDASSMPVLDLWKELSEQIGENREELANWMAQSEAATDLFTEDIAEIIGQTENFAAAQEAAERGIVSAVGTYRQNYFIALLENWERVQDVLDTMNESAGYSQSENEKAMERLTARMNQLTVAAQELAVQFGEAGFLDFLKLITDAGTAILKFTKDIGGLRTVLALLTIAFVNVKKTAVDKWFNGIAKSIGDFFVTAVQNAILNAQILKEAVSEKGLSGAFSFLGDKIKGAWVGLTEFAGTAHGAISIIAGFIGVVNLLSDAYMNMRKEQAEARKQVMQEAAEYESDYKEILDLRDAYESANKEYQATGKNQEELSKSAQDLVSKLQEQGLIAKDVGDAYEYLAGNMNDVNGAIEQMKGEEAYRATEALKKAGEQLQTVFSEIFAGNTAYADGGNVIPIPIDFTTQDGQNIAEAAKRIGIEIVEGVTYQAPKIESFGDFLLTTLTNPWATASEAVKTYSMKLDTSTAEATRKTVDMLRALKDYMLGAFTTEELSNMPFFQNLIDMLDEVDSAAQDYDKWANAVENFNEKVSDSSNTTEGAKNNWKDFTEEIKTLGTAVDEVTGKISDFQSSWDSLIGVVDDYNETGYMTADMVQKLLELEPEYLAVLEEKNGKLYVNEQQAQSLIGTNSTYLQQLAALRTAEEIETLATELQAAAKNHLTLEEVKTQIATENFNTTVYQAALDMIQGKITAEQFAASIANVGSQAGLSGQYLAFFGQQAQNILNTYKGLLSQPIKYNMPSVSVPRTSSGGGGGGSGSGESAAKKALQAEIKAWQQREKDVKDYYKKLKETTEDYYDGLIEQLEDVEEANDRINKQLDYYNNRQEALRGLEQARSRSGVEAREKEVEYQQKLIELDDDWRKTQNEWDIEDRIDQLKEMKEIAVEQIEDAMNAATKAIEDTIEKLQEKVNNMSTKTGGAVARGIGGGISAGAAVGADAMAGLFDGIEEQAEEAEQKSNDRWDWARRKEGELLEQQRQEIANQEEYANQMLGRLQDIIDHNGIITEQFRDNLMNYLPSAAAESAKKMMLAYDSSLFTPMKKQIKDVMGILQATSTLSSYMARTPLSIESALNPPWRTGSSTTNNNFSMFANINGASGANAVERFLNSSLRANLFN